MVGGNPTAVRLLDLARDGREIGGFFWGRTVKPYPRVSHKGGQRLSVDLYVLAHEKLPLASILIDVGQVYPYA